MVGVASENLCCFQWSIPNPFLPWRKLEATFYHGSPTTTQWKVTIHPIKRRPTYWTFSFSLEFDEWFDPRYVIIADSVVVLIKLNSRLNDRKEVRNYRFCKGNWFMYYFESSFLNIKPQIEPHQLDIAIEISLPGRATGNEMRNWLFNNNDDLRWLSSNLKQLLEDPKYYNMKLLPRNDPDPITAHSYIVDARWNNFFKLHDFEVGTRDTVKTNISRGLLLDILTYMYSGILGMNWPDWQKPDYTTELFQVIHRYKLYHFYKVFVKNDLMQVLETRNPALIVSRLFPLDIVNGRPVNNTSQSWHVSSNPEYEFSLQIRVFKGNRKGPWLSYTLQSRSPSKVCARVIMELVKNEEENAFHERDCTIDPGATSKSGPVFFLGCSETFGDTNGTEINYALRCFVSVVNGTTVDQVRCLDDFTLQNDLTRFRVLSQQMHKLRELPMDADMQIQSRSLSPGVTDEYQCQVGIHKGVLASRVPQYWEGLENVQQTDDLPGTAISILSNQTLSIVLDYMYTGKFFTIPILYINEVEDFAHETLFYSLIDFVNRIRTRWIDR